MGVIDLDRQGHSVISNSKKWCSMSLLYADLGWPKGITRPKRALINYLALIKWSSSDFKREVIFYIVCTSKILSKEGCLD